VRWIEKNVVAVSHVKHIAINLIFLFLTQRVALRDSNERELVDIADD
jgi:hypothetical protein